MVQGLPREEKKKEIYRYLSLVKIQRIIIYQVEHSQVVTTLIFGKLYVIFIMFDWLIYCVQCHFQQYHGNQF